MKTRIRPIARAGVFGSQSNTQIVSEQDLQEIYESFTAQDASPITIGHVTEAAEPRLGSVVSLELKDGILYGIIEEQDELAKAVDAGFSRNAQSERNAQAKPENCTCTIWHIWAKSLRQLKVLKKI
ncbi:hypothetical protein [Treponema phagedenis]|uniref:hypothetical protein n=1 Tax=Treponema phagedenis TaxID=162 RepID=UPI0016557C87|nr:hypothetical protein [Treponema phagedenis]